MLESVRHHQDTNMSIDFVPTGPVCWNLQTLNWLCTQTGCATKTNKTAYKGGRYWTNIPFGTLPLRSNVKHTGGVAIGLSEHDNIGHQQRDLQFAVRLIQDAKHRYASVINLRHKSGHMTRDHFDGTMAVLQTMLPKASYILGSTNAFRNRAQRLLNQTYTHECYDDLIQKFHSPQKGNFVSSYRNAAILRCNITMTKRHILIVARRNGARQWDAKSLQNLIATSEDIARPLNMSILLWKYPSTFCQQVEQLAGAYIMIAHHGAEVAGGVPYMPPGNVVVEMHSREFSNRDVTAWTANHHLRVICIASPKCRTDYFHDHNCRITANMSKLVPYLWQAGELIRGALQT